MIKQYSRVKLITNRYVNDAAPEGALGYIIEVYDDGKYEVEFSDRTTGITFAQLVVAPEDVIESPETDADTADTR